MATIYIEWDPTHPKGHTKVFYDPNLRIKSVHQRENNEVWVELEEINGSTDEIKIGAAATI